MNKREAAKEFVKSTFSGIPQSLVVKAYENRLDDCIELTKPYVGSCVEGIADDGYVTNIDGNLVTVEKSDGMTVEVPIDNLYVIHDSVFPMWGTMWLVDNYTVDGRLQELSEIGFRIYEIEEGFLLGIDGAGYDFYEHHWIPLYELLGYSWHDEE